MGEHTTNELGMHVICIKSPSQHANQHASIVPIANIKSIYNVIDILNTFKLWAYKLKEDFSDTVQILAP